MRDLFFTMYFACLAASITLTCGCGPRESVRPQPSGEAVSSAKPSQAEPAFEPTWPAAVDAVRRGESIEIRLNTAPIEDAQLADLAGLAELRRINLPRSQISDRGLEQIVKEVPQLELLRLGSPQITDAGLASISQLKKLRFLHLIDVPLTDAGLKHLEQMTWLESFYLDGGNVTDTGLSSLIEALPELHFHRDQQHLPGDPRSDGH